MEAPTRAHYTRDLAKDRLWRFDMLEDVEDPHEVELGVAERKALRSRHSEVNALWRRRQCRRERRLAHVAAMHLQVWPGTFHSLRYRTRAASNVEHPASKRFKVGQEITELEAIHVPRLRLEARGAPPHGFVVERRRRSYWVTDGFSFASNGVADAG